jgi:serine/threonine protein kinase
MVTLETLPQRETSLRIAKWVHPGHTRRLSNSVLYELKQVRDDKTEAWVDKVIDCVIGDSITNLKACGSFKMFFDIDGDGYSMEIVHNSTPTRRRIIKERLDLVNSEQLVYPHDDPCNIPMKSNAKWSFYFTKMKYCVGGDLLSYIQSTFSNDKYNNGMKNLMKMGKVLAQVHAVGVYLIDIKPENVLICQFNGETIFAFTDLDDCAFEEEIGTRFSFSATLGYSDMLMRKSIPGGNRIVDSYEYTDWHAFSQTVIEFTYWGWYNPQIIPRDKGFFERILQHTDGNPNLTVNKLAQHAKTHSIAIRCAELLNDKLTEKTVKEQNQRMRAFFSPWLKQLFSPWLKQLFDAEWFMHVLNEYITSPESIRQMIYDYRDRRCPHNSISSKTGEFVLDVVNFFPRFVEKMERMPVFFKVKRDGTIVYGCISAAELWEENARLVWNEVRVQIGKWGSSLSNLDKYILHLSIPATATRLKFDRWSIGGLQYNALSLVIKYHIAIGSQPIHLQSIINVVDNPSAVESIIDAPYGMSMLDAYEDYITPITMATMKGRLHTVKLLVEKNADVSKQFGQYNKNAFHAIADLVDNIATTGLHDKLQNAEEITKELLKANGAANALLAVYHGHGPISALNNVYRKFVSDTPTRQTCMNIIELLSGGSDATRSLSLRF